MSFAIARLLLATLGLPPVSDTALTVQGIVAVGPHTPGGGGAVALILSDPLVLESHQFWALSLLGDYAGWSNWDGHYVEVRGRIVAASIQDMQFTSENVRDVTPRNAVTREVTSLSHRSTVLFAVAPHQFRGVAGAAAGISPMIFYEVVVDGQTNLVFEANENELVCASVTPPGGGSAVWRDAWRLPRQPGTPLAIRIGPVFRVRLPIPSTVFSSPGRYTVQATLCRNPEFSVTTTLDVTSAPQ